MEIFMYLVFFVLAVLIVRERFPDELLTRKEPVDVRELNIEIAKANEELRKSKLN